MYSLDVIKLRPLMHLISGHPEIGVGLIDGNGYTVVPTVLGEDLTGCSSLAAVAGRK
jgi:hypothetical protein